MVNQARRQTLHSMQPAFSPDIMDKVRDAIIQTIWKYKTDTDRKHRIDLFTSVQQVLEYILK